MDRDFANWFCGFVDGEGCFALNRCTATRRTTYIPQFIIGLRADDYDILETCKRAFDDIGSSGISTGNETRAPKAQWSVTNAKDLNKLVVFFDEYRLRAKKAIDFELWKQAVSEYNKPHKHRNQQKLAELCRIMSQVKKLEGAYEYHDPQLALL